MLHLSDALLQEMSGVLSGSLQRRVPVVDPLFSNSGNRVIFDAREGPLALDWHVGAHVVVIEVESDIAVEISVMKVAWITLFFAPDLPRRIQVASERRDAVGREHRRKDSVA